MIPQRLAPRFLEKVWGSTRLGPWFPDTPNRIGEVWFEDTRDLGLLIKFLFTTEKLSVQVHPDDAYARLHHASAGKTEMWHVLAAEPGSKIAAGFQRDISPELLREAAASGEIMNLLQWHDARPGDTFFIPAGTVHAIGEGLAICEIQQWSNVTYRLYDYGRPRKLHLDHGVTVSRLGPCEPRPEPSGETLVSCGYFHTRLLSVQGPAGLSSTTDVPVLAIILQGSGEIAGCAVQAGETWRIPAPAAGTLLSGDMSVLAVEPRRSFVAIP